MLLLILIGAVVLVAVTVALIAVPIERLAYIAVGVFLLLITWNGLRVGGGSASNVAMVAAFGAVILQAIILRRPPPLPPWLLAAGGGFVLASMLNLIFPPDPSLLDQTLLSFRTEWASPDLGFIEPRPDLFLLAQFGVSLMLIPMLVASVATTPGRINRLIDLFVLSATVNAAVGIVDYAGLHIAPVEAAATAGRTAGLTLHPNYLALTCTIAVPLALLWVSRGGRWRTAGLISTVLLLVGGYATGSRAGAVSALLALILTIAVLPSLRRALGVILPIAGIALVPLLVFTSAGREILQNLRLIDYDTSGSDRARSNLATIATNQFQARPIQGVGMGVIQDAHTIYLQLLAAAGLIGMASFLTFVAGLMASVRRTLGGPLRDAGLACGVAVLAWLANGAFDAQLADKYLYVIPGFLVAMAAIAPAAVRARAPRRAAEGAPAPPRLAGARPV